MDKYKETELLRMTKDELIEHVLYIYKIHEIQWNELCEWYVVSEEIQRLRKKHMGFENDTD